MAKLGYTWYPKDWGNSESVFELDLSERGLYRELIDLAMLNDNKVEVKKDVWQRKFAVSNIDLEAILLKLIRLNLIEINDNLLIIPSCESRLQLVRGGREGGKNSKPISKPTSKPTHKPTHKPNESLSQKNEKPIAKQRERENKDKRKEKEDLGEAKPKHKIIIWLENNCPTVQKMKEPITEEQAIKIHDDFSNNPELVANTFLAMENKPDLLKKYKSANLTFRNWAKNDFGNSSNSGKDNPLIEKWETPSDIFMCMDWIKRIPKPPDYETQTAAYEMFMYEWRISELMRYQFDRCGAHSNLSEYEG
jgi:hypothetical protein